MRRNFAADTYRDVFAKGVTLPDQNTDVSRLVAATVNRLRLIQVDFADQPPDVRENYLSDEVEHALAKLLPEQRGAFIQELKERFPTWEGQVDVTGPSQQSPTQSASDVKDLQDYLFLIARLTKLAPTLTEEQRKTAKALRAKLQLTDKDKLDPRGCWNWPGNWWRLPRASTNWCGPRGSRWRPSPT